MNERGFKHNYHKNANSAIDDFVRETKYSLIVTDLQIAPGVDYTDPKIKEIMRNQPPNYWEVSLRMIELTRSTESVNKDTPIVVVTIYHPQRDKLFSNAKKTCLETGATDYIYLMDESFNFKKFYNKLEKLALNK